ncbi:unnamed protein product [Didymodactylos carnosus]|uniref:Uncharacterized protein n=1 Tax=Didymodactylos carnosus TaxID=1234261 RepID=A0A8S2V0X8_9BILA|nr:unnamed protein product [Didymodactylos carnosus]CAF4374217.1 unnamed protein product [Didymodactylos carnosus]
MVCLTVNGDIRWKLYLEYVPEMRPVGASNIVSDQNGTLYYTVSWAGDGIFSAKICRVSYALTSHPYQECVTNTKLYMNIQSALAINEKFNLLITAVADGTFESVPAAINKTSLEIMWINRENFGAGMNGHYKVDSGTGNMFWIGGDDNLLKFDAGGNKMLSGDTESGAGRQMALDIDRETIVRPWQNMTDIHWPLIVSSWSVSKTFTLPSLPLVFAINSDGKTMWTTEIATGKEIDSFDLISWCSAANEQQRVMYTVSGSATFHKGDFRYFITSVHMDTGKVLKQINVNGLDAGKATPSCPILIGDDMLYFFWLTGEYPDLVPLKIVGMPQIKV